MDRNKGKSRTLAPCRQSLSARRAWIEIQTVNSQTVLSPVALRKESVDRNFLWGRMDLEITPVALRKESVDRNSTRPGVRPRDSSRSPQGERG